MMLNHCFRQAGKSSGVVTLHCNAQTTAAHVIQKIQQACSLFSTNTGRVYRPRESERLVLYLKDINLPKPDKYDTCMLIAFLQQLITCSGFYDENLEFLGLERVHIVASMNPATTVGRHSLSSRFTAVVRIAYVDYVAGEELVGVYASILESALVRDNDSSASNKLEISDPKWRNPSNLKKLADTMVQVFENVQSKFSVDDHRHYLFTPRDLTEWVLGLLRYETSHENLLSVFVYEGQRMFRDRLVDNESRNRFDALLASVMRKDWQHRLDDIDGCYFSSLVPPENSAPSFLNEAKEDQEVNEVDSKQLCRIPVEDFKAIIEHGMMMYEREEKELNIKLFDEALENFSHVDRVLSKPGGSMLLVGRSGVGRRTTCTLVAHMHGMRFFSPNVVSVKNNKANIKAFMAELKLVVQSAGVDGTDTVLYIEDHQIFSEDVLETINSLLCSGEAPGLYKHEELVPLLEPLKEKMQDDIGGDARTTFEFFLRRIQKHLHVVISMDPTNDKFLVRCESNPALYTKCSILWFGSWTSQSMKTLPAMLFPEFFGNDAPEEWDTEALQEAVVAIHSTNVSSRSSTPRDFISFLESFQRLHELKASGIQKKVSQFLGGLSKLEEAAGTVDVLSEEAGKQRIELQQKQQIADQSMDEITDALQLASKTKRETETLAEELKQAEEETMQRKAKIEDELSEIQPILESAKEAVGGIKTEHLSELKSMKMPPDPVADVLSAVLMLLGIDDTSWLSMKKFLGNRGVKEDILNFDTHRITPEIRSKVMKLLRSKASAFERETIERCSVAAAPFAAWVKANIRYSLVLEKIEPLEAELDEAKDALESAQGRMEECERELADIDNRVKELQENFKRSTREAETLNIKLQETEQTLDKAQHLLGQLGGEQERWSLQAKELKKVMGSLPMRILLSAAFVTYLGRTPEDVREKELQVWSSDFCMLNEKKSESKEDDDKEQEGISGFDVKRIMSSESEMLVWKSQEGLPGDGLSMENAIIILNSPETRCPFIIDPATSATNWLKYHLGNDDKSTLEVVPIQDPRFVNQVELAVRFGKTLVVVEVDTVEPLLYPLIRRDLKRQGPRWVVQIGDKLIDYNENFRLMLATRNPFPKLSPDASSLVNVVNFTVTKSGLEGQLLGVTVQYEQPELEDQKSAILKKEEDFKVQLADLERELLDTLAASDGNLLENQALLDTLSMVKTKSAEVSESLQVSAKVSIKLDQERNQYRPFAEAGSLLYFTMAALSNVNHMYQFSLQSFIQLFKNTLQNKSSTENIQGRMDQLIGLLEKSVLYFVGRAIFKIDRLMFGVHFVHIARAHLFQPGEWEFLTGEGVSVGTTDDEEKQAGSALLPSWAAPDRSSVLNDFQSSFPRLVAKIDLQGKSASEWSRWGKHPECEKVFPPGLTPFQQVLVTKVLRPDRLESAMTLFCCDALGVESLSPPQSSIATLVESNAEDSTCPILLIATPGSDPSKELEEYAATSIGRDKYFELAMGGGQTDDALSLLRDAARNGDWICLKNLHLVSSWIPRLEKEFNSLDRKHENFKLWLTTEETSEFAPILLQQSVKVTFEAPPGLKKNLQRTYESWSDELIERCGGLQSQLMFLLAWFHALLQERRTYIPQGWIKFYEFSLGDLRSGLGVVQLAVETVGEGNDESSIDWPYIHGLMENSVYGGRVDNPFDLRVLRAYLSQYFNSDMLKGGCSIEDLKFPRPSTVKNDYVDWIDKLDDNDTPALFGLPSNIERSVQRARSAATVASLKSLSSLSGNHIVFDREEWCRKLLPIVNLWESLTQDSECLSKPSSAAPKKAADPVDMFVFLEETRAFTLLSKLDKSIRNIAHVVKGTALLTPQIQVDASSLMCGDIPAGWRNIWDGPESQQEWLRGAVSRKLALKNWVKSCSNGSLFDRQINLSDLFNPGTFLNALRQQTARKLHYAMDGLRLVSAWSKEQLGDPKMSIALSSLSLQGAIFDGSKIQEPDTDAQELVRAPDCFLAYVPFEDAETFKSSRKVVSLPMYQDLNRENLLLELDVPIASRRDADKWIVGGVAFFLS